MNEMLPLAFKVFVVIFLWGTLVGMGLRLDFGAAIKGLRNVRFVLYTLVWAFILAPALAYLIAMVVPMDAAYANGVILQGLTPCAPFVALLVDKARGDIELTASLMLLCFVGVVIIMPLALPHMVSGMSVTAWVIGKPVLMTIALPMAVGMLIRRLSEPLAGKMEPAVKKITGLATLILIGLILVIYGRDLLASIGSFTTLALLIYFLVLGTVPYLLGFGLQHSEKIVLGIGITSRNIGAAIAPAVVVPDFDDRTTVVILLSLLYMTIVSLLVGKWFGKPVSAGQENG